ncbi:uridylate kinase [Geomonas sp. RF6]|uniref:amino acid kinase family protein n=1 Tax=Geomonas sp. RF6 TaxID=2897342 RepID=UPI001E2C3DFC|nr:uridylate kinase [Geomonas sp. RF6]UFS70969.1 uridylate kinase [Geomonas sp. RF6]
MNQRHEIDSSLKGESLARKGLMKKHSHVPQIRLVPDLNVVKIGGHGVIDYGREVVLPLMRELGELSLKEKMLVVTGGGVRVRHILDIGIDLGMPTGVLAELAGKISEQNAEIVTLLLSEWKGSRVKTGDLLDLPTMLHLGLLPVTHGTPPYGLYEHPPGVGLIPPHRTDTGALLMAEVLGARSCILVKNVDGLYTEDPRVNPKAELIEDIGVDELIALDMEDMVLERKMLYILRDATNISEIRIVNGHSRGNIEKAMNGERVGTVIRK